MNSNWISGLLHRYGKSIQGSLAGEITGLSREAIVVFLDGYVVTIKLPSKYLCLGL